MLRLPKLALKELIGARVRVARSACRDLEGIEGIILDETRNTFVVKSERGIKRIPKAACTFLFVDEGIELNGRYLVCAPEERTKKLAKYVR